MLQDDLSKSLNEPRSVAAPEAVWPSFGIAADGASPAIRRGVERWLDLTHCWIEADRYDRPIIARQIDRATSRLAAVLEQSQGARR